MKHGGALLVWATTSMLVRATMHRPRGTDVLADRLELAEAEVRAGRTLLHEVASAVAAISSAAQLLESGSVVPPSQRAELVHLLVEESARVQRLLRRPSGKVGSDSPASDVVDVDRVLAQLVLSQQVRGRTIEWSRSGHRVLGCADEITQVLAILLDNVAEHAGATSTRIRVEASAETVTIGVRDDGVGLGADHRGSVLEWGVRGLASTGQGIGLSVASDLARQLGGRLAVQSRPGEGTEATVTLTRAPAELEHVDSTR